jgi:hypothetical protein
LNLAARYFVFLRMDHLLTDVRSGVRMLVKYPTLSLVSILTLGLGIGRASGCWGKTWVRIPPSPPNLDPFGPSRSIDATGRPKHVHG